MIKLLQGDCRVTLPTLPERSVQACITSPPYWGLRDYGTEPLVWGGEPEVQNDCKHEFWAEPVTVPVTPLSHCRLCGGHAHEWGSVIRGVTKDAQHHPGHEGPAYQLQAEFQKTHGSFCSCGAWLGNLGLEPTPELYIEHMVEVFRHVRRVLKNDGVLWLNLGDAYAGSGKGPSNSLQSDASQMSKQTTNRGGLVVSGKSSPAQQITRRRNTGTGMYWCPDCNITRHISVLKSGCPQCGETMVPVEARQEFINSRHNRPSNGLTGGKTTIDDEVGGRGAPGYKAKDLMMLPARVAIALQQDGWYLRSQIPWLKRNSMPESVTDRPATAVEYVFLLSKSARYYWDADAVRQPHQDAAGPPSRFGNIGANGDMVRTTFALKPGARQYNPNGRNLRNADFFFQSWQGLLTEDDEPLALIVNPAPLKMAHFASFPTKLVEPMVKASTSEKGECPECGKAWVRVVERGGVDAPRGETEFRLNRGAGRIGKGVDRELPTGYSPVIATTGWRPSCTHAAGGLVDEPDAFEIVDSPTGSGGGDDPTLTVGRRGMSRPRGEHEGVRQMTRYEQRRYAVQLRESVYREQMEHEAGAAFAHYLRTDRSGARPIPQRLLENWLQRGWLQQVGLPAHTPPVPVPQTVLDPFSGANTVALVADRLGRNAIGCELKPDYVEMGETRLTGDAPMFMDVEIT